MKFKNIISLFSIIPLLSCSHNNSPIESRVFCFDTSVYIKIETTYNNHLKEIEKIFNCCDKLTDNYRSRDINNVYTINNNLYSDISIDKELYDLLTLSFEVKDTAIYFNPLCGSLSKKWKNSLSNKEILSETIIEEELFKMNNTQLLFKDNNVIQKIGDAEIDLGGIAKGYALDKAYEYLKDNKIENYIINAGNSSILLGTKNTSDGYYSIGLNDVDNAYLKLKNCFITTSSKSVQGVKIGDITYSHIINPINGSAINENDAVIVISDKGYLGDALSTSMMMNTVEEIKEIEQAQNIKTIVIKNNEIIYKNEGIEVLYH